MSTMTYSETLTVVHCWCGIALAIPDNLHRWAKDKRGRTIYCPLGHEFVYNGDTFQDRLERAHERERATRALLEVEQRRHAATKGNLTKERKAKEQLQQRAAAGVCPCCHRTFQQLARHMKSKHPDWTEAVKHGHIG